MAAAKSPGERGETCQQNKNMNKTTYFDIFTPEVSFFNTLTDEFPINMMHKGAIKVSKHILLISA